MSAPLIGVAWTDSVRKHAGPPLGHRVRCLTCHLCIYHDGSEAERALALAIVRTHHARRHARPGAHLAEQLAAIIANTGPRTLAATLAPLA